MKKYLRMFGSVLLLISLYVIPQFIAGAVLGVVIALNNIEKAQDPAFLQQMINANIQYAMLLGIVISTLIFFIGYSKMKDKIRNCDFTPISFKNTTFAVLIGFLLNIFISLILMLIQTSKTFMNSSDIQEVFSNYAENVGFLMDGNIITVLLIIGILVPIFEEILYRGLIYKRLVEDINIWVAIIIQAILFGLTHFNLIQGLYTFVLGIILALTYHWVKSIWAPIIIHITFNSANYVVNFILPLVENSTVGIIITSVISIAFILIILYKIRKDYIGKYDETNEVTAIA
ncbi:CPBP family intramembrane glutamic endopeptidase [Caloranaerobacter ferrireducens]|uniref:CPBP family intramembrane glutamic endopeptidase n=1 Tax=Caloranaerobacter ferrireducens TaxID=1323370 RepID=UPI00084DA196|nr:type II CAAX endopeptidase family protein [Caloranaerobacter ferrireducens]